MILALSTSSPRIAAALLETDGVVAVQEFEFAERNASEVSLQIVGRLMSSKGQCWSDLTAFAADIGPGGFTGVKVGVTLVKMWAAINMKPVYAVSAFDLISPEHPVAIPYKRNAFILRVPGMAPKIHEGKVDDSFAGYGGESPTGYPDWINAAAVFEEFTAIQALSLVPNYVVEPSISKPKVPYPT